MPKPPIREIVLRRASLRLGLGLLSGFCFGWCDAADCGGVKLNNFSCPPASCLLLAGDLCAGDLHRPALADLSCAVCLMHLFGNIAEDNHFVPGGFTLLIVDRKREAGERLVTLAVVPGVSPEPTLQL